MTEESLFDLLLKTPETERAGLLDRATEGNPHLRARVEALLKADAVPAKILAQPPAYDATTNIEATASYIAGDVPGVVIAGRYKLLEEIGEGGMGTVWMAQQSEPVKRLVAIKLIKVGMDSKAVLARFEAERQALAMMDHPNIAKVLDGGIDTEPRTSVSGLGQPQPLTNVRGSGRPYFVMELVKGTPITKFCDERKLSLKERLELFVPVCQAIQHAHQKGVIHRDIKPSNVLIALYDDKPVPKVIDFGVAKATGTPLTEETLHTGFGAVVGTPEYMSPEQASLNNLDVDTRSDVYALGVLMYELLTGTTPVDKKSLGKAAMLEVLRIVREVEAMKPSTKLSSSEALASIAANRHTEPAKLCKLMKGELDWIVMKALEKDRARRYETANGFAQDIQRYLTDGVVEARPASAAYRVKKWIRRNPLPVAVASSLFLAITAGVISTEIQRSRTEQETNAKLAAFEKLEEEQEKTKAALVEVKTNLEAVRRAEQEAQWQKAEAEKEYKRVRVINRFQRLMLLAFSTKEDNWSMVRLMLDSCSKEVNENNELLLQDKAGILVILGMSYQRYGDLNKAQKHLEQAYEISLKIRGTEEINRLGQYANAKRLAECYHAQHQYVKAEPLWIKLYEFSNTTDPEAKKAVEMMFPKDEICKELGNNYLLQRKYKEAEKHLREAIAFHTEGIRRFPPQTTAPLWIRSEKESLLGGALLGQSKHTDAEQLLLSGYTGLMQDMSHYGVLALGPKRYSIPVQALDRLIQFYTETNKPDAAAKWKQELDALNAKWKKEREAVKNYIESNP